MKHFLALPLSALLVSGAALAQGTSPSATGQSGTMSDSQIRQQLESQGYSNVKITQHDKNHVDVTASKSGQAQKLVVNPQTGQASPDTDNDD